VNEKIIHVTDAEFDEKVLGSEIPVLVDFWAEWCAPCKMIAPFLDDAAEKFDGQIQVAKVDVDANRQTPIKFGIRGFPTLMIFKDGKVEATRVGALSPQQLDQFIEGVTQASGSDAGIA